MSFGQIIRIIESIVTIFCGIILAVRPAKFRWNKKFIKIIFGFLILLIMLLDVSNTFWAKYSSALYIIIAIYLVSILFAFFKVNFLQVFSQFCIYWFNIRMLHYCLIMVTCWNHSYTFWKYIEEVNSLAYDWLHIFSMLIVIVVSIGLVIGLSKKPMIRCKSKKGYLLFSFMAIVLIVIDEVIFTTEHSYETVSMDYLTILGLLCMLIISVGVIITIGKANIAMKVHETIFQLNDAWSSKQYNMLKEMYNEKRIQIHDINHQHLLILSYLEKGDICKAKTVLREYEKEGYVANKSIYTGWFGLDYIINHKYKEMQAYNIVFKGKFDVFFNPFDDRDSGILLGNLLDNAIEAVKELPEESKVIDLSIKTINEMFVLQLSNPYSGKRKKAQGYFLTTKTNQDLHGLGLLSVEKIVNKYCGNMEISDNNNIFCVCIMCPKTVKK